MIAHFEDSPPNIPPREPREDVVSWGNRICADKRAERLHLLALDFDDARPGEAEAALKLRGGRLMVNSRPATFGGVLFVAVIIDRGEPIYSQSKDRNTAIQGALLLEFSRAGRCKRMPAPVVAACRCGKPAVRDGLCRGCDEDRFYGRHIPGAKLEGAE